MPWNDDERRLPRPARGDRVAFPLHNRRAIGEEGDRDVGRVAAPTGGGTGWEAWIGDPEARSQPKKKTKKNWLRKWERERATCPRCGREGQGCHGSRKPGRQRFIAPHNIPDGEGPCPNLLAQLDEALTEP